MSENTLPFRFKWVTTSPDPHSKTMRNTLEPEDIFVEIGIPVKAEFFANAEAILKEQLGVDVAESTTPILKPAGMKYAIEQLSLLEVLEPVDDVEWDDAAETTSDDDESWDDDAEEDSWDDENLDDIDWDE